MRDVTHKAEYMNSLLQYIEDNLSVNLDTELLSSIVHVSAPKLYRDFYDLTGHSVKEYIRKRRLSNALDLIKTSDMEITDIAFKCGYSSHQALCRAIRQMIGLTPTEYKGCNTYYFFPPFSGGPLQSVTISNDIIPQTLRLLYYNSRLMGIENIAINKILQEYPNYCGRIFGRNGKQDGSKFCYELYLSDTEMNYSKLKSTDFVLTQKFPCFTALFAMKTVRNDERKINAAWDYLYSKWLQFSMFEYTNDPYYEEYIIKNNKTAKLKLYLPIRERSKNTKITLIRNPGLHFITAKAKG